MRRCAVCEAVKDVDRTPTGWKEIGGVLLCDKCKRKGYALRGVTLRITSPVGCDWKELRSMLRASFTATTRAANWTIRQLALGDPGLDADGKIQKLPAVEPDGLSLYKGVAQRWPELDTTTAACVVQDATKKYRACRFKMLRGEVSLPSIRYPQPIPVHNRNWSVIEGEDGGLFLTTALGRRNKATVRLSGGVNYRRQLMDVRRVMSGEARKGELKIHERGSDVLVTFAGWFPKTVHVATSAASLVTGGDAFLTLYNDERQQIYRWNADHVRQRIAAQDERMQRLREDLKAEKRLGRERDGILARMAQLRDAHGAWAHSFCHEVSKQVVEHLRRRRCGVLMYLDADKSYVPHFPWHKLGTMLADKANRAGIEIASGEAVKTSQAPLEEVTQQ